MGRTAGGAVRRAVAGLWGRSSHWRGPQWWPRVPVRIPRKRSDYWDTQGVQTSPCGQRAKYIELAGHRGAAVGNRPGSTRASSKVTGPTGREPTPGVEPASRHAGGPPSTPQCSFLRSKPSSKVVTHGGRRQPPPQHCASSEGPCGPTQMQHTQHPASATPGHRS